MRDRQSIPQSTLQQRFASTAATPGASGKERVNQIVEEISRLTLLETADLIAQLKVPFYIGDSLTAG
jgi:hypothetical protein